MHTKAGILSISFFLLLSGCGDSSDNLLGAIQEPEVAYSALIERTEYGTAHITADDRGSLGFGQGYATAQDHFCVLADQFLKVRSERARYFGPGDNNEHITSDFAYLGVGVMDNAESVFASWPDEGKDMVLGYVAGLNQYLTDTGVDNLPGECAGQDWVQTIDVNTLVAYTLDLSTQGGSRNFLEAIANAAPPGSASFGATSAPLSLSRSSGGSNAFAIGSERSASGRGLLLANPHWPWEGERLLHEVHLTISGDVDVAGVSIPGLAGVMLGFNDSMAWSHTTTTSNGFIIYSLDLVPGNPTRYFFGNEERDMESVIHNIDVLQDDGSLIQQTRTQYTSQYGPMLDARAFGLAWSDAQAYTIFDVNSDGVKWTFGPWARARSVDELREVFLNVGGRPNSNVLATDRSGGVLYADISLIPNLSEEAETAFRALVEGEEFSLTQLFYNLGFVYLNGSDPLFSIEEDDRATILGAKPFIEAPQLTGRRDFVANFNDSYWLSNPGEPLTGHSLRYGQVETPRSTRTRMGLTQISESDLWDRESLKEMLFENRSYTELLWREIFVSYCSQFDEATSSGGEVVAIGQACAILSSWDGRYNIESIGAIVNRELLTTADKFGVFGSTSYFSIPFDPLNPVETPRGLSEDGKAYLLIQLADAVLRLEGAGIPLDAPLGNYAYTLEGDERFALHGGRSRSDGILNIVAYAFAARQNTTLLPRIPTPPVVNPITGLFETGYLINFGSTFIMAVEFTDDGPIADAILTYSQSDDPNSPHFSDQMSLFSRKTWRPLPFTREQIEADPTLTSVRVSK